MNNEELKQRIGANIARLRKKNGMTQAELAERINYSDKAVSKWERAESMPDVLTLIQLAEQFGTDMNELLGVPALASADQGESELPPEEAPAETPEAAPAEPPEPEKPVQTIPARLKRYKADQKTIQLLSSILVWVVVSFLYLILDAFGLPNMWMLFVVAVPANAIVLLSLRAAWRLYGWNRFLISVILWSSLLIIYLLLLLIGHVNVWKILPMGLLGQAAILLWFKMFRPVKEEENHE